jgi:hypothetical protein
MFPQPGFDAQPQSALTTVALCRSPMEQARVREPAARVAARQATNGYDVVARTSFAGTVVLLVMIGFTIFGPQVLLVGTAPTDHARRGTAAAACGFVDFMGYMGRVRRRPW